ncbi:MAG: hypothetical protein ACPG4K_12445 [Haloferula sp.]
MAQARWIAPWRDSDEALAIPGIGEAKIERYARPFLDCIADFRRALPK